MSHVIPGPLDEGLDEDAGRELDQGAGPGHLWGTRTLDQGHPGGTRGIGPEHWTRALAGRGHWTRALDEDIGEHWTKALDKNLGDVSRTTPQPRARGVDKGLVQLQ